MPPTGMRRWRPLMSSGTRAVSVVLVGINHHGWRDQQLQKKRLALVNRDCCSGVCVKRQIQGPGAWPKHLYNCLDVLGSQCGKHRGNSSSQTQIQRHQSDRFLVYGIIRLRSNCCQGRASSRNPFAGKLDLFFEAEISIVRSRKSDLHTLTEVVLKNPFAGIRSNYLRTQTAAYFVELIEICTERDHREPELFGLLRRAFGYLGANDPTPRAVAHFETELARITGVHDEKNLKTDPAFALGNLFGRLPLSRTPLLKTLAAEAKNTAK
jgi:DNA repair protein RecO (recombination protein O)